ncbi:MAG: hypothetical protein JWR52_656 [Marmoricola sp.]|nr:hypothetical protein [Marmoricola sp.]
MSTKTADLGAQIAEHRDRLTETVGALADKIDTHDLADGIKERAATGAGEIRESASTRDGRRGLILGLVGGVICLVLLRRLLR